MENSNDVQDISYRHIVKNRDPIVVAVLSFFTFGIYQIYWLVKTKGEINQNARNKKEVIISYWIILIPLLGPILFFLGYAKGVSRYTRDAWSQFKTFILLWVIPTFIGLFGQKAATNVLARMENGLGSVSVTDLVEDFTNSFLPLVTTISYVYLCIMYALLQNQFNKIGESSPEIEIPREGEFVYKKNWVPTIVLIPTLIILSILSTVLIAMAI